MGLRTSALHEVDSNADGAYESSTRTEFLIDHHNFTGYAQTIKEVTFDANGDVIKVVEYTIGHDEIGFNVNRARRRYLTIADEIESGLVEGEGFQAEVVAVAVAVGLSLSCC